MTFDKQKIKFIMNDLQHLLAQEDTLQLRRKIHKELSKLDEVFWGFVSKELQGAIEKGSSKISMHRISRAIANSGLLTTGIIPDAPEGFKASVYQEVLQEVVPPVYYFTDWLINIMEEHIALKSAEYMLEKLIDFVFHRTP